MYLSDLSPENEQGIKALDVGISTTEFVTSTSWQALPQFANRRTITIKNSNVSEVKIREDNTGGYVGFPIDKRQSVTIDVGPGIDIYIRANSGTPTVYILEAG